MGTYGADGHAQRSAPSQAAQGYQNIGGPELEATSSTPAWVTAKPADRIERMVAQAVQYHMVTDPKQRPRIPAQPWDKDDRVENVDAVPLTDQVTHVKVT